MLGIKRLAWLTVAVATIGGTFAAVGASAASFGGFGVRPAQSDPRNPATRAYFILQAPRGSTRHESVVVSNGGRKRLVLAVDAVDGLTGVTSGVVYANRGVPVHGAGAWVTPAERRVSIPPRSSVHVGFVVNVPAYARPGDHVAGIAIEALHPTRSGGSFSVTVVVRTVIGIEIQVPGAATRRMRILSVALAPLPGTTVPSAVVTLEDIGGKLCKPRLTVAIKGRDATRTATQTLGTILPGDRIAFPFRWPGSLGQGHYAVSATSTRCGAPTVMHTVAAFSLAGTRSSASSGSLTNVGPTAPLASTSSGLSWWVYILIALGALGAAGLLLRSTRGRKQSPG